MAIEVEMSDGSIAEFPDGTPQEVMLKAAKDYHARTWKPRHRSPQELRDLGEAYGYQHPATEGMSGLETFTAGVGKSFMDTGRGLGQLAGLVDTADVDRARKVDEALLGTKSGIAGNMVGVAGQMAIPGTNAAKLVSYGGRGSIALKGAAQAAPFSFAQPVGTGESRGMNTAVGSALGAGGAQLAPFLRNQAESIANAVRPEVRAVWEAAKARGISLTPAQLSDSRFLRYLEQKMRVLPGSGAAAKAEQQKADFNRKLANTIGSDAPVIDDQVYAMAKKRDSLKFEELSGRNNLSVKPELIGKLEGIVENSKMAGDEIHRSVRAAVDRFYGNATTGESGVIVPGRAYQSLDSDLGKITRQHLPVSAHIGEVKHAIREAMDDSISPVDRAAWQKLRQEYANRKMLRDLVSKSAGAPLPPAQVMGRVTSTNHGKELMATGRAGELGELAKIGQRMKEPPTSGSPEGQLAQAALNPLNWPMIGLQALTGNTLGRALNSNALASVVMRENRGQAVNGLARLVEKTKPQYTLPAAGVVVPQAVAAHEKKKRAKD